MAGTGSVGVSALPGAGAYMRAANAKPAARTDVMDVLTSRWSWPTLCNAVFQRLAWTGSCQRASRMRAVRRAHDSVSRRHPHGGPPPIPRNVLSAAIDAIYGMIGVAHVAE